MANVITRALRGVNADVIDPVALSDGDDTDAPGSPYSIPDWGSPAREEPSSAYIARARGFAERLARVALDDSDGEDGDGVGNRRRREKDTSKLTSSSPARRRGAADVSRAMFQEEEPSATARLLARDDFKATAGASSAFARARDKDDERIANATPKSSRLREHIEILEENLAHERKRSASTMAKYEELGAHATVVLRQRDEARAALEVSTTRERAATARVDELVKRLDEERAMSEQRLDDVRRSTSAWRDAQLVEVNAMKAAAESMMRDAKEAADRVEERIASRVSQYERRLNEAERDAAKRARESMSRFGARASTTEVQAAREISALTKRVNELDSELTTERRERSAAQHAAATATRDLEETRGQFESFRAELASARDVVHARDEALDAARRDVREARAATDECNVRIKRLDDDKRDLQLKVSSLEEVLGDVGGYKKNVMTLRARIAHLISEIHHAKEIHAEIKREFEHEISTLKTESVQWVKDAVEHTRAHYESRLRDASEHRVASLEGTIATLKSDIEDLKREHARTIESAVANERASIAAASEASIRASTQRTIAAEKAKALAELARREAEERLASSIEDRDAMERVLVSSNEHIAAVKAEVANEAKKRELLMSELKEARANVRDLTKLLDARSKASSSEDDDEDDKNAMERMRDDASAIKSALESAKRDLADAKAETVAAVKRAEDNARLEIDALRRGLEMATEKHASDSEARIASLERELSDALEAKHELRDQLERYEALTALQDDAMSASKSQVRSLSARLRSLETSVSGSPMPSSPFGGGPPPSPSTGARSFFLTPQSAISSPVRRPLPTPMTLPASPRSPARSSRSTSYSPIKPKSPLFKDLE